VTTGDVTSLRGVGGVSGYGEVTVYVPIIVRNGFTAY
jgi:hypothetical protein